MRDETINGGRGAGASLGEAAGQPLRSSPHRTGRGGRPILTIASTPLRRAYPPMPSDDEFDGFLKAINGGS